LILLGFSSTVNLFQCLGNWDFLYLVIMYLHLVSVDFTCYGYRWTLEVVLAVLVFTWVCGSATTTATSLGYAEGQRAKPLPLCFKF